MNIDDINEVVTSIVEKDEIRDLEVNFNFIYNNYIENETSIDDNVIKSNDESIKKNRFVRINVENPINFSHNRRSNQSVLFNNLKEKFLNSFIDKDLYVGESSYFNKMDILSPHRKSFIVDNMKDEFQKFLNLYSSSKANISDEEFKFFDRSRRLSFRSIEEYEEGFVKKDYVESFNYENTLSYEKVVNSEKITKARKNKKGHVEKFKSGNLLPELNYVSRSINEGDFDDYASSNAVYCGFYVEKYVLKDGDYKFLCSRFYLRDENSKKGIGQIEDEAVKYGETYKYVCYNTYIFTTVDIEDRFLLKHYLLCSNPYISQDIVCKEFDSPPTPTGFTAIFNTNEKNLVLKWRHPTNYENDVKGYQILKRFDINSSYFVVRQLEGHLQTDLYEFSENIQADRILKTPGYIPDHYIDDEFDSSKMCIYTIRSIDAHGQISEYGEQIAVYYDFLRNKLIVDLISHAGANINYPNEIMLNKSMFFENQVDVVDNLPIAQNAKKVSLYFTPDYGYITSNEREEKVYDNEYQFTISNLNNLIYRSDKFTISNFG